MDASQALAAVADLLADGGPHQVVTVNPEFLVRARRDPRFRRVLNESDLATIDGVGVALALRLLWGLRVSRVTGADLMEDLMPLAVERHLPVFLLGAMPGVAGRAAGRLAQLFPGLTFAGVHAGSPGTADDAQVAGSIRSSGARLLFVAFGAPEQEYWIARNLCRLGPCVAVGVGGAFDYLAGAVPRAPVWMRRGGLEWLYRLVRQPSRLRRQLALPVFVYLVLRDRYTVGSDGCKAELR